MTRVVIATKIILIVIIKNKNIFNHKKQVLTFKKYRYKLKYPLGWPNLGGVGERNEFYMILTYIFNF